ncbi:hypothetical protein J7L60_03030 [Candidatus Bathyarchaeota archaeon]|nr:hypothetical protein [Candidatus Bathyarchaeota archaeon]
MGLNKSLGQVVATYSALIGLLYAFLGFMEILTGLGLSGGILSKILFMKGDMIAGAVLITTGVVYLAGVGSLSRGEREGLSFVVVGVLLSTVIFALYLSIMGANALGYILGFEGWVDWTWIDDVNPGLWLWFLTIPGIYISLKREWRE